MDGWLSYVGKISTPREGSLYGTIFFCGEGQKEILHLNHHAKHGGYNYNEDYYFLQGWPDH